MAHSISNELRRIIDHCGLSRYEIAKRSGLSQSMLSRFMSGTDITTRAIDRLAPVLGLKITADAPKMTKKTTGA